MEVVIWKNTKNDTHICCEQNYCNHYRQSHAIREFIHQFPCSECTEDRYRRNNEEHGDKQGSCIRTKYKPPLKEKHLQKNGSHF